MDVRTMKGMESSVFCDDTLNECNFCLVYVVECRCLKILSQVRTKMVTRYVTIL